MQSTVSSKGTGLYINNIPAIIRPASATANALKRSSTGVIDANKTKKFALHSLSTPINKLQWSSSLTSTPSAVNKKTTTTTSLGRDCIVQAIDNNSNKTTVTALPTVLRNLRALTTTSAGGGTNVQIRRPTVFIKTAEVPKRTVRSITMEMIERAPMKHLGISVQRLPLLKGIICNSANVAVIDCYLTLKKIRLNEDFGVLADYFEFSSESEAQQLFVRTLAKLSRFMQYLLRWSNSKKYYDRRKAQPFAYRAKLSHVQSLTDCVETDMLRQYANMEKYKFLLSISLLGMISYVSKVYVGHHDDLCIFKASNFQNDIPKHLSLAVLPGKGITQRNKRSGAQSSKLLKQKRTAVDDAEDDNDSGTADTDSNTDSADETNSEDSQNVNIYGISLYKKFAHKRAEANLSNYQPLRVVDGELTSSAVRDLSIPIVQAPEKLMRERMRATVGRLREFKVLQHCAIKEPIVYQYLNEILVVAAALSNLRVNEQ